jgi:hypothetical protein
MPFLSNGWRAGPRDLGVFLVTKIAFAHLLSGCVKQAFELYDQALRSFSAYGDCRRDERATAQAAGR